ncbi:MAG: type II toxin-antitoxin system VapC family toxin [Leptolyngbyaceae cyanobacterium]
MGIYFIDSSALVKRYINEVGSTWVLDLFTPTSNNEIFIAAITSVEIIAAITRAERSKRISASDALAVRDHFKNDLLTEYQVIEIAESIIVAGMTLAEAYGLRGYDAIQLAAGCTVNTLCISSGLAPIVFVSADNELNVAASNKGLIVENPNMQP